MNVQLWTWIKLAPNTLTVLRNTEQSVQSQLELYSCTVTETSPKAQFRQWTYKSIILLRFVVQAQCSDLV